MANKYTCPHCGAIGYSSYEDTPCGECGKRPSEDKEDVK